MARGVSFSFSGQQSSLEEIQKYHFNSECALNDYYTVSNASNVPEFTGYTKGELDTELKARKETLDRMCSFEILATIEARFYTDYIIRCQKRKKDDLSRIFRKTYKKRKNKVSLMDDIMKAWKNKCQPHKTRLDNFGKALEYRNWLAHGRYWIPKKSYTSEYDYLTICTLASDILENMNLHEK